MDEELFSQTVRQLSYHSCAMQYWYFVKSSGLSSSLSLAQINEEIATHRRAAKTQREELLDTFETSERYNRNIIRPSKERILGELERFGSNITRKSHGIGEIEDVRARCNTIADGWIITMPDD